MTEPDAFQGFSKDAVAFLGNLRAHNERAWFNDNKKVYERVIKRPAEAFSRAMAAALDDLTGKPHGHKIFRVHRDVRFSKDKTPYNAYLRIAFIPKTGVPSWFFGFDPDKLGLGTGVFAFDKADLHRFRERILGSEGAELVRVMDELEGCGIRFGEPDLKRVPAGLPKDHPREKLLRYKGLSAWVDHPDPTWIAKRDVVDACMADFARLKPVFDWLDA